MRGKIFQNGSEPWRSDKGGGVDGAQSAEQHDDRTEEHCVRWRCLVGVPEHYPLIADGLCFTGPNGSSES